jgi:hypothetical protein
MDVSLRKWYLNSCLPKGLVNSPVEPMNCPSLLRRKSYSLRPVTSRELAQKIVESRLKVAFAKTDFLPAYPTWPFMEKAFDSVEGFFPREILQECDRHRQDMLIKGQIKEVERLAELPPPPPPPIFDPMDLEFESMKRHAIIDDLFKEDSEEKLGSLLQTACTCLVRELTLPENVDKVVEVDFEGSRAKRKGPLLNARIRLIYQEEKGREEHFCFRALQKTNPISFQASLKAAFTLSGIDRNLPFRHLTLVRTTELPGGAKTRKLIDEVEEANGLFIRPTEDDLRILCALRELETRKDVVFDEWLKERKPVSKVNFMKEAIRSAVGTGDWGTRSTENAGSGLDDDNIAGRGPDSGSSPSNEATEETESSRSFREVAMQSCKHLGL